MNPISLRGNFRMADMDINELQQILSVCLDEIVKLKEENINLRKENSEIRTLISTIKEAQIKLYDAYKATAESTVKYLNYLDKALDNIKYESNDPALKSLLIYPQFYSFEYTIEQILSGKSLCRFGDGEFDVMEGISRHKFQGANESLGQRLREVFTSNEENILIAIADNYGTVSKYNEDGKHGIRLYMNDENRRIHAKYVEPDRTYHNAYISRPYSLFADNHSDAPKKHFDSLKRIWNDRKIIIIEGCQSRLGYGNDLFSNAKSISRIEGPAINSYDRYNDLFSAAKRHASNGCLFLLALGASATVMAYDLAKEGYQALDVGHLDLEYDWWRNGKENRCATPYKYSNETFDGDRVQPINDPTFEAQIIEKIY